MKIIGLTPFLVAPRASSDGWSEGRITVFVKLETDDGLTGWGEAYALTHRERATCAIIVALGEALKDMPHASPRAFLHHIAQPMSSRHPGIDYAAATSAIEIALWDLAGKSAQMPVHAMLGGALIDGVPVCANAWDAPVQTPQAIAERCAMMCSQGYGAVKIYPLRQPTLEDAETCVRLTREAVGPDVDIMLDFAVQKDRRHALRAARLFEPYAPFWIEEPLAGDDLDGLAEFRALTTARITTGERQAGLPHYRNLLDRRAADILNPDIAGAGGIITMLEIGAMANAHSVLMSPHCWNSTTVAFAAMLHACAVMPNSIHAELYYDYLELGARFATCDHVIHEGRASLPRAPGLGVMIDEEVLRSLAA